VNAAGGVVCPYNNPKVNLEKKLAEIVNELNSDYTPSGLYFLDCKKSPGARIVTERFEIMKGNGVPAAPVKTVREKFEILSEKEALDALIENATLKAENDRLRGDLAAAEEDLKDMESQQKALDEGPEAQLLKYMPLIEIAKPLIESLSILLKNGQQANRQTTPLQNSGPVAPGVDINLRGQSGRPYYEYTPDGGNPGGGNPGGQTETKNSGGGGN
jgi:regulator of replication initiation timing